MRLDAIAVGNSPPNDLNVIIEVPVGREPIKYELDKASGTLVVDSFLYTPMRYPGNYGFVPHTLSADGDPIDMGSHRGATATVTVFKSLAMTFLSPIQPLSVAA